jgi:hypothetical protein
MTHYIRTWRSVCLSPLPSPRLSYYFARMSPLKLLAADAAATDVNELLFFSGTSINSRVLSRRVINVIDSIPPNPKIWWYTAANDGHTAPRVGKRHGLGELLGCWETLKRLFETQSHCFTLTKLACIYSTRLTSRPTWCCYTPSS